MRSSGSLPRPRVVPPPRPRTAASGGVLSLLAGGLLLAGAGLARLPAELDRQIHLAPLAAPGGWQRAFVDEGAGAPAARAEAAARRGGDPVALTEAAGVLAGLSAVSGDPASAADLRRRALELARAALATSPGLAQAHLLAGAALTDMAGEPGQVDWHLARAAALDPHRTGLRRNLGLIEIQRGRTEAAAAHFRAALEADPQAAAEIFAALAELGAPLSPGAITPSGPRAQVALGGWLESHGDVAGARAAFETALTLAEASPAGGGEVADWAYRQLAGHLFRQGLDREAEALATRRLAARLAASTAEEALLAHHRGVALEHQGRSAEALPWLRQAWELDPASPEYAHGLALALARQGRHAEAAAIWQEALALPRPAPGGSRLEAAMRLERAASLAASGERQEALREVGRVLVADPLDQRARALAQELAYE